MLRRANKGIILLEWSFLCGEWKEFIITFSKLPIDDKRGILYKKDMSLNSQRLYFCLDRPSLTAFKVLFGQFRHGTKEPEYLSTLTCLSFEQLDTIVPFIFRDRLFGCISNYAYT